MLRLELIRQLKRTGVRPDRDLGQNFLVNPSISSRIAAALPSNCSVLEIGPGMGALTEKLISVSGSLTCVEISSRMYRYLEDRFADRNIHFVNDDILKTDPSALPGYPFQAVAGNLPYSISSPILFRLIEDAFSHVETAVVMLQREVARRLCALEGGRDYGKLSLQIWPVFQVEVLLDACPEDFHPAPDVHSRVVILRRRPRPLVSGQVYVRFRRVVKVAFAMRRKTILNNLRTMMKKDEALGILRDAGIDPGQRAEQLPPKAFIRLAEVMYR